MPMDGRRRPHIMGKVNSTISFVPLSPLLECAVSTYDPETARHSIRVARAVLALARSLTLSPDEIHDLWWSAILHDVGKLGVPREVLAKRGALTESDWAEIRRHPVIGAELVLAASPDLGLIADAVRAHHESWDGAGYPDHLAGPGIPFLARIITLADVFDALTHRRPYRDDRLSPQGAIREIQRGTARQFDPELAAVFVDVFNHGLISPE